LDNGYDQQPLGRGRVRFTVQPAIVRPPRLVPLLVLGGAVAVALLLPPAPATLLARVGRGLAALAVGVTAAAIVRAMRVDQLERMRSPGGEFVVSPGGVELGDGAIVSAEPTLTNRLAATGPRSARAISYALCCRTADGIVLLAGGMSERVARALLKEVNRILQRLA
jgi:hypothetical protein